MRKKSLTKVLCLIFFSLSLIMSNTLTDTMSITNSIVISAENIPDNNSRGSNNSSSGNGLGLDPVDAEDVFGPGITAKDETGYSETINSFGVTAMKFIVNTCVDLFAIFLTVVFIVDCVCIPFPALNKFFAETVPIQLFSNEVVGVTGISYSGGKDGKGGNTPPPQSNNQNGEQSLAGKYIAYARDRAIALIVSGLIMVLTYTGLMQDLLNIAINTIVSLITG